MTARFAGGNDGNQCAVTGVALGDHVRRQLQLRVGQDAAQLVERAFVDQAFDAPGFQRGHDWHHIHIGPVEEVENNVGVEDDA